MKIGAFYGTTLRIHPAFLLILLLYIVAGQGFMILAYVLTLLLHELGHYAVASKYGLPVSEIELTPFGGVMRIHLSSGLTGRSGVLLAAAGILVNGCCLIAGFLLYLKTHALFPGLFAISNLSMILLNLLPALPLDGGRMLFSIVAARYDRQKTFRLLLLAGRVLSALLLLYCLYSALQGSFKPIYAILSCYLLYAASLEEKQSTARYLSALFARRYRLENDTALPVQQLCVSGETPLFTLLPQLHPRSYHLIHILDDTGSRIKGTLQEEQLYAAILNDPVLTMEQLLSK